MFYKPRFEQLEARRLLKVFGPSWTYLPSGPGNATFDCISANSCIVIQGFAGTQQASFSFFGNAGTQASWIVKKGNEETRVDMDPLEGEHLRLVTINPKGPSFSGAVYNADAPRLKVTSQWDQDPSDNIIGPFLYNVSLRNKFGLQFEPEIPPALSVMYQWGDQNKWHEGTEFERNIASFPAGPTVLNVMIVHGDRVLHTYNVAATVSVNNSISYDLNWEDRFGNKFAAEDTRFLADVDAGGWTANVSADYIPTPNAYAGYEFAIGIYRAKNTNHLLVEIPLTRSSSSTLGVSAKATNISVGALFDDLVPGVGGVDYAARIIARPPGPNQLYSRGFTRTQPIETTLLPSWMQISAEQLNEKVKYQLDDEFEGATAGYVIQVPAVDLEHEFPDTRDTPLGIFDGRKTNASTSLKLKAIVSADRTSEPSIAAGTWSVNATLLDTTLTSESGKIFPESGKIFPKSGINVAAVLEPHTLRLEGGGIHITTTPLKLATNKVLASKSKNLLDLTVPLLMGGGAKVDAKIKLTGEMKVTAKTISAGAEVMLRESGGRLQLDRDLSYVGIFVDANGEVVVKGEGSLGISAGIAIPAGTPKEIADEISRFEILNLIAEGTLSIDLAGVVQANFEGPLFSPIVTFDETNVTAKGKIDIKYDTCFFSENTRKFLGLDPCGTDKKTLFKRNYGPVQLLKGKGSGDSQEGEGTQLPWTISAPSGVIDDGILNFGPDSDNGRVAFLSIENTSADIVYIDSVELLGTSFRFIDVAPGVRGLLPGQAIEYPIELIDVNTAGTGSLRIRGGDAIQYEQQIALSYNPALPLLDNRTHRVDEVIVHSEGTDWTYQAAATMGTGTFRLVDGPAYATIDSSSGVLQWSPPRDYLAGRYHFVVERSSSANVTVLRTIAVDFEKKNTAPRFEFIREITVDQYQAAIIPLSANDSDYPPQQLTFRLVGDTPDGLQLNQENQIVWTPSAQTEPRTYYVGVEVTDDGQDAQSSTTIIPITVREMNQAPYFRQEYYVTAREGQLFELQVEALDIDSSSPTYRLEFGSPEGVTINAESGLISWTPGFSAGGQTHRLTVAAIDAEDPDIVAYTSVWIDVLDQQKAMTVAPVGPFDTSIQVGLPFAIDFAVLDEEDIPLYVEYELSESDDSEAAINYLTGHFQWQPTTSGVFEFNVLATGYGGGTARQASYKLQLQVLEDEVLPSLIVGIPDSAIAPVMTIEATDNVAVTELQFRFLQPDSQWMSISWEGNVAVVDEFLMAEARGAELAAGDYEIQVRAIDAAGNISMVSRSFKIEFDAPQPAIISLAEATDSLPLGDFRTDFETIHLQALTEPFATVEITPAWQMNPDLDVTLLTVVAEANEQGIAQFSEVSLLKFGKNLFDVVTTDVAGNSTASTFVVSRLTPDGNIAPDGFGYRATRIGGDFQSIAHPSKRLPFDDGATSIQLTSDELPGFSFSFYGTQYDSISVGLNGLLAFNATADEFPSTFLPTAASIGAFWTSLQFIDDTDGVYFDWTQQGGNKVLRIQWQGYTDAVSLVDMEGEWQTFPVRFSAELHCLTGDFIFSFDSIVPEGGQFWEQMEAVFVKAEGDEQSGQRALVISQGSTPYDLADNDTRILVQQLPEPFPPFLQGSLTEEFFYNGLEDVLKVMLPLTGRTFDASSIVSLAWTDSMLPGQSVDLTSHIDEWGNFNIDREMIETILGMPLLQGERTITLTAIDGAGFQNQLDLSLIIDEVEPTLDRWQAKPGQSSTQDGDVIKTSLSQIDLEGTTEPHAFVFVYDAGGSVYTATADGDGNFNVADLALWEGENAISIEIIDRMGNVHSTSRLIEQTLAEMPEPDPLLGYGTESVAGYRPFGSVGTVDLLPGQIAVDDPTAFLIAARPGTRSIDLGSHSLRLPHGVFTGKQQLFVSTDGYVTIGGRLNESLAEIPTFDAIEATLVAPLWSDWIVDPNSEYVVLGQFETERGSGLADRLIIQWQVYNFSYSPNFDSNTAAFQVVFELNTATPGAIAFQYFDLELQPQVDGSPFPALIGMHWATPGLVDSVELQPFESEIARIVADYQVQWDHSGVSATVDIQQNNPFIAPTIALNFSDPVTGVDITDLEWIRNGESFIPSGLQLSGGAGNYLINFVTPLAPGDYRLTLVNDGSIRAGGKSLASPTSAHFAIETANAAPTDILLSGTDLAADMSEAVIGEISMVDVDPHPNVVWQTSDPRFFVDGQLLKYVAKTPIHPQDEPQVQLTITATENGWVSNTVERTFTINIVGPPRLPDAMQLRGATIFERIEALYVGEIVSADGYSSSYFQISTLDDRFRIVGTSLWLADSQYLDAAAGSSQAIDILLTSDNGKFERSYSLPITLRENSTPFRNPRDPLDVNNRGGVTAIDALMIINVLNRGNYPNGILPRARSGSQVFDRYYDVSGDNLITPIDALRIINFLNRRNVNGEAEGEARIQRGEKGFMVSISSLDTNAVDAVWRDAFASDFWFSQDSETHRKRRLF